MTDAIVLKNFIDFEMRLVLCFDEGLLFKLRTVFHSKTEKGSNASFLNSLV